MFVVFLAATAFPLAAEAPQHIALTSVNVVQSNYSSHSARGSDTLKTEFDWFTIDSWLWA